MESATSSENLDVSPLQEPTPSFLSLHWVSLVLSVVLLVSFAGLGYLSYQNTQLRQQLAASLDNQVGTSALSPELPSATTNETTTMPDQPASDQESLLLSDLGLTLYFPKEYVAVKSNEENRRGSFISYGFNSSLPYQLPALTEIQLFSEDSIRNFNKDCDDMPCFEGEHPDITRYQGQKTAFLNGKNYNNFVLKKFGTRNWFVSTFPCTGDSCVIREYTTFIGDTEVDVWIMMTGQAETKKADEIFAQIRL